MGIYFGTREAIAAWLESALLGISGMKRVDRQHMENFENYEYPSAFLNELRESRKYVCSDVLLITASYTVVIFSKSEDGNMSTLLNTLITQGLTALTSDGSAGGVAYGVEVASISTDQGFMEPHCAAIFMVNVSYLGQV
jgi:hypothetical protein